MHDPSLTETEAKIHTPDLDAIRARLDAAGATLEKPRVHEHNIRYEDAGGTFSGRGIVLRLRRDSRVRLTYKAPLETPPDPAARVFARFEAEVTVDDLETMDTILQRLGFHPFMIYEKYRTTYRLGETEVVLDELPFGHFTEIEGPLPAIEAALDALGLADAPRIVVSYAALFYHVRRRLGLDAGDLTFANFAGVDVPPELFAEIAEG